MEQLQLNALFAWFDRYVQPFLDTDDEGKRNIALKIVHTRKVCDAMSLLAEGEQLSENDRRIASAAALLHDAGRFPQYRQWRTFRDSDSDNHARLSIDVIRREKILSGLEAGERLLIEEAVRYHNLLTVPGKVKSPTKLFINLVRDADKIDIWRVFTELLALPPGQRASAATLGFADLEEVVTGECITTLDSGKIVHLEDVRTLNDFKLLQISWVYDLTSATARRLLLERGHITALAATLPHRDDLRIAVAKAIDHLSG